MRTIPSAVLFCGMAVCALGQKFANQPPARQELPTASGQSDAPPAGKPLWLVVNGRRVKTKVYGSAKLGQHPVLIVVLHGDSPSRPPSYHYAFARTAAEKMDDVVIAALLRPGYTDDKGDHSDGERGLTTGDNYTPEVVDAIAGAIDQLKAKFHPVRTVLAGHSGGAAITGDLLGRWPSTVDATLMVSCPCDLAAWRAHMMERQHNKIWLAPVSSLSPIDLAPKVQRSVRVRMLVGSEDPVTLPAITQKYANALRRHVDDVTVTIAPKLEHDILLEPVTFDALSALVDAVRKDNAH